MPGVSPSAFMGEIQMSNENDNGNSTHPLLVTEPQAADLMGVCAKTVFNWRRAGLLPCLKVGANVRYSVDSIRAFIRTQETFCTTAL